MKFGNKIVVTDPCYEEPTMTLDSVPGYWVGRAYASSDRSWGRRIQSITVTHEDHEPHRVRWEELEGDACYVDSGQAGVFDAERYDSGRDYDAVCEVTLSDRGYGHTRTGFVSSSGYGDGGYPVEVARDRDGLVIGVRITFIEEDRPW